MSIHVYIDGEMHEPETALVSVFDRGFLFGDSVYETIALIDRRLVFLPEHLDRLERSASRIYLDLPARARVQQAIRETVAAAGEKDARIRVMVTRGVGGIDLDPATAGSPRLIVIAQPLGAPTAEMLDAGAAVALVKASRTAPSSVDPAVKSGNYLGSVLAIAEARRKSPGVNEAITCSGSGSVAEGATSNVFMVESGRLVTPALDVGILDGVTRGKVLELARGAGIETQEVTFLAPESLRAADEVFLTSAVRGILPITMVDGARVGIGRPGPVTRNLLTLYQRLISEAR
jgi:Branched-chain amino acid aminotransferase/4-amino-4-deoxychorismate lyase